jgi:peroxiredoxin
MNPPPATESKAERRRAAHQQAIRQQTTGRQSGLRRWLLFVIPIVGLAVAVAAGVVAERDATDNAESGQAPGFTLPTTHGGEVVLADVLAQGTTMTYFSMGLGCDGCFAQIPEIQEALAERDIALVSIMPGQADALAHEAQRFGIQQPILIDEDGSVSESYGMLGQFGHGNSPSHSFALISADGIIERTLHYPTMFVPLEQLLEDFGLS